ncbi:MAG: F0F1 ATP synthase subunit B [Acidobacteriota bacterium]
MLIQPEPGLAIWTVVTFLLLVFVLGKFVWKPMLGVLSQREQTIREALEEAQRAKQDSERLLEKNQAILGDARNQANALLEKARQDAELGRAEMAAKARQEAESLLARSREEIERQKRLAIQDLRSEAIDLALGAASHVVGAGLDSETHRRLIDDYFESLPARGRQA